MKFCISEIAVALNSYIEKFQTVDEFMTGESLALHLEETFNVPVSDEGLPEDTFKAFVHEYCG